MNQRPPETVASPSSPPPLVSQGVERIGWMGQLLQVPWLAMAFSGEQISIHTDPTALVKLLLIPIGGVWFIFSFLCATYFLARLVSQKAGGGIAPTSQIALASLYVAEAAALAIFAKYQ